MADFLLTHNKCFLTKQLIKIKIIYLYFFFRLNSYLETFPIKFYVDIYDSLIIQQHVCKETYNHKHKRINNMVIVEFSFYTHRVKRTLCLFLARTGQVPGSSTAPCTQLPRQRNDQFFFNFCKRFLEPGAFYPPPFTAKLKKCATTGFISNPISS